MKHLLLIRHAESDWVSEIDDFSRPLNARGHKNAPEMAYQLLKKGIIPQQIVSSTAVRAITTANHFAKVFGLSDTVLQHEEIYEASASTLLKAINLWDDQYDFIAIVGHNPGLSELAIQLCNVDVQLPTCGIVMINFPLGKWNLVSKETGELLFFDYPKNSGEL